MDIMYITRKAFQDNNEQKSAVQNFISAFRLLRISKKNISFAFSGAMKDFEDAVQVSLCKESLHAVDSYAEYKRFRQFPGKSDYAWRFYNYVSMSVRYVFYLQPSRF